MTAGRAARRRTPRRPAHPAPGAAPHPPLRAPSHGRRLAPRAMFRRNLGTGGQLMTWVWRRQVKRAALARRHLRHLGVDGAPFAAAAALRPGAVAASEVRTESFVFGTRLTRVTRLLRDRDRDRALARVAETVNDWAGGTRIGESVPDVQPALGAADAADERRRHRRLATAGIAATRRSSRPRRPACGATATAWSGSTRWPARPATSRSPAGCARPSRTSTTSCRPARSRRSSAWARSSAASARPTRGGAARRPRHAAAAASARRDPSDARERAAGRRRRPPVDPDRTRGRSDEGAARRRSTTWQGEGADIGRAVVVRTFGSAPRPEGAVLLCTPPTAGSRARSAAAASRARRPRRSSRPARDGHARVIRYGISDEQAWDVGLACGGTIDVLVEPAVPAAAVAGGRGRTGPAGMARRSSRHSPADAPPADVRPAHAGRRGAAASRSSSSTTTAASRARSATPALDAAARRRAAADALLRGTVADGRARRSVAVRRGVPGPAAARRRRRRRGRPLARPPRPRSSASRRSSSTAGRRSRRRSASPDVDRLIVGWPDEVADEIGLGPNDAVAVLTHDVKFDEPAIVEALRRGCRYVGAVGQPQDAGRPARAAARGGGDGGLRAAGRSAWTWWPNPAETALRSWPRSSPSAPAETALAIMAEIVANRYGGDRSADAREGRRGGQVNVAAIVLAAGASGAVRRRRRLSRSSRAGRSSARPRRRRGRPGSTTSSSSSATTRAGDRGRDRLAVASGASAIRTRARPVELAPGRAVGGRLDPPVKARRHRPRRPAAGAGRRDPGPRRAPARRPATGRSSSRGTPTVAARTRCCCGATAFELVEEASGDRGLGPILAAASGARPRGAGRPARTRTSTRRADLAQSSRPPGPSGSAPTASRSTASARSPTARTSTPR